MILCIIAFNRQHFEHIKHLYRIEPDQCLLIERSDQIRPLIGHDDVIIIFGEEWWRHKSSEEIQEIEYLVKIHNERRKKNH